MNKMLIIGNGPSTKDLLDIGFKNIPNNYDTFAMNSFYRFGYEIDWFPKYYAAYDSRVTPYHKKYLKEMMEKRPEIKNIFSYNGALTGVPRFKAIFPRMRNLTTGGASAWISIMMGYKEIALIGIDANYVDFIDESEKTKNGLVITKDPVNNPNYFYNKYQLKGDEYRRPNKSWHHDSWNNVKELADEKKVKIINCSDISEITLFEKSTLKKLFNIK